MHALLFLTALSSAPAAPGDLDAAQGALVETLGADAAGISVTRTGDDLRLHGEVTLPRTKDLAPTLVLEVLDDPSLVTLDDDVQLVPGASPWARVERAWESFQTERAVRAVLREEFGPMGRDLRLDASGEDVLVVGELPNITALERLEERLERIPDVDDALVLVEVSS